MFEAATTLTLALTVFAAALTALALASGWADVLRRRGRIARALASGTAVASGAGGGNGSRLRPILAALARAGRRVEGLRGRGAAEAARLLATAGFHGTEAMRLHALAKAALPVAGLAAGLAWALLLADPPGLHERRAVIVLAATLGLSLAPDILLARVGRHRMDRIRRSFPDMLELLVIVSEAGLGPHPALRRVGEDLADTHPQLAAELRLLSAEMALSDGHETALSNLERRVPLPEVSVFCNTLKQSERQGTPFARALRVLMHDQRAQRLLALEERAARVPVYMTFPMIFFIMPSLFVVLVGPGALNILDNILNGGFGG